MGGGETGLDRQRHFRELLLSLVWGGLDSVTSIDSERHRERERHFETKKGKEENYRNMRGEKRIE